MILVDTGYLIALIDGHDQLHRRACAWDAAVAERLLLSEYVLLETVNFFSRGQARQKVHSMLEFIRADETRLFLQASQELFDADLSLHRSRPDQDWSLTDCISFHVMKTRNISEALSQDHHFEQAGFTALLRNDPP